VIPNFALAGGKSKRYVNSLEIQLVIPAEAVIQKVRLEIKRVPAFATKENHWSAQE